MEKNINDSVLTDDDLTFFKQNIKFYFTGVVLTILIILVMVYFRKNENIIFILYNYILARQQDG